MRLLLATRNGHKLRELSRMVGDGIELDPLPDGIQMPPETGATYAENALIKARAVAQITGRTTIADDSGIEADALDGGPGIHTARYAGPSATDRENLDKFRQHVPAGTRLRYVCVIAHVEPDGEELVFTGLADGTMAADERGARGFGYDPIFIPDSDPARTFAELSDAEKDAISHRGEAARALRGWLLPG
jgi:XTP/dITP diphosphohydrolase